MSAAALSPAARRDFLEAINWIAYDNPAAARALRSAVAKAAANIGTYTHFGVARPDLADPPYRFVMMTGFPYVIVYNPDRRPPLIVRIFARCPRPSRDIARPLAADRSSPPCPLPR